MWQGKEWRSAEHAYQAAKFFPTDGEVVEVIRAALTSGEAKRISKEHQARRDPDWAAKKLAIMEDILRMKLDQDKALQRMLIATESRELVEDSSEDSFWGRGPDWQGENWLGRLWMKLRRELQER